MSAQFFVSGLVILSVLHLMLLSCAYLILLERKVASWAQDRIGPNRVGFSFGLDDIWNFLRLKFMVKWRFFGLGHALVDGVKLIIKEDYTPPHVDRSLFFLAPVLAVVPAMMSWAIVPWGGAFYFPGLTLPEFVTWMPFVSSNVIEAGLVEIAAAPLDIGVVYILALGSLAVYAVTLAGYASNNKYSFLGGMRATAQMISYEIPMGVIVLIAIISYGTLNAGHMISFQAGNVMDGGTSGWWGIIQHPLLAVIFFTCILAECNRAPFDLAEAEQELVGGFHTEYGSMKWALFFLGEYMHMIVGAAFFTILFLGGWDIIPFFDELPLVAGVLAPEAWYAGFEWVFGLLIVLLKFKVFLLKVAFLLFVMMWVRWTLPRFRFDQLMKLAWGGMIPITIVMLLIVGCLAYMDAPVWTYLIANIAVAVGAALLSPLLPDAKVTNQKVKLEGSRFSAPDVEPTA